MNYFHDKPLLPVTGYITCSDYKLILRFICNYHTTKSTFLSYTIFNFINPNPVGFKNIAIHYP